MVELVSALFWTLICAEDFNTELQQKERLIIQITFCRRNSNNPQERTQESKQDFKRTWVIHQQVILSIPFFTWKIVFNILIFILLFPIVCFLLCKVNKIPWWYNLLFHSECNLSPFLSFSVNFFSADWNVWSVFIHFFTDKQENVVLQSTIAIVLFSTCSN